MTLVFHQNMRDFGGAAPWRNTNFGLAFTAINGVTGANYVVAGFTEVMNGATSRPVLAGLAAQLDPGLTRLAVIETGCTVGGQREFVGIAWDPVPLTAQHVGLAYWNSMNKAWQVVNDPMPAAATFTANLPRGLQFGADARGLAYIAGVWGGNTYIFGFLHEMYNIRERGLLLQALAFIVKNIRQTIGGAYAAARPIIGGDINVAPQDREYVRPVALRIAAAQTAAGPPIVWTNTTAANPYDWWVVSSNIAGRHADVAVRTQTRTYAAGMTPRPTDGANVAPSDHGGITIDT
jgi:hypothetical protein